MTLLLDSHVWLWLVEGTRGTVTDQNWSVIRRAVQQGNAAISDASFWEFSVKGHKLNLKPDTRTFLSEARKKSRIGVIELDRNILIESGILQDAHRDPADRMLIVTALRYDLRLATADDDIVNYAKRNPRLKVLDVRVSG